MARSNALEMVCTAIKTSDMQAQIKQALPENVTLDRFTRVALTMFQQNPEVVEKCDRNTIYTALTRAAQDGLLPDGREGAIVAFGERAQWMPMVAGIIKRLAESGISIDSQVVCANDHFHRELGDDAKIVHTPPKLGEDRGEIIGAYAIARTGDGMVFREVMDKKQLDEVRAVSRSSGGGPWKNWYGEMARKSVIRRLAKRLPITDERTIRAITADETLLADEPDKVVATQLAGSGRSSALDVVAGGAPVADQGSAPRGGDGTI